MVKDNIDFINTLIGCRRDTVDLNKNIGTVTMEYLSYYMLYHDSTLLRLLMNVADNEAAIKMLEEIRNSEIAGKGFSVSLSPMSDIDSICFVYGVTPDMIQKFFDGGDDNA